MPRFLRMSILATVFAASAGPLNAGPLDGVVDRAMREVTRGASRNSTIRQLAQATARDHPLAPAVPGLTRAFSDTRDLDAIGIVTRPLAGFVGRPGDTQDHEGRVTRARYAYPSGGSTLAITRAYTAQLQAAGFRMRYQCADRACSPGVSRIARAGFGDEGLRWFVVAPPEALGSYRYLVAERTGSDGVTTVAALIGQSKDQNAGGKIALVVVESGSAG